MMRAARHYLLCLVLTLTTTITNCTGGPSQERTITVAAAANLNNVFTEIGRQFEADTGIRAVFSFAASGALARQIENGAPFDLFAAADVRNIEALAAQRLIVPGSKRVYARGRLVLWWPAELKPPPATLNDITKDEYRRIAIAKPDIAPYGAAARECLEKLGLWSQLTPKIVYAENVSATRQYAHTGNADLAFIPRALVKPGEASLLVDEQLHKPIEQALCIPAQSKRVEWAKQFDQFLAGPKGRALLEQSGYVVP